MAIDSLLPVRRGILAALKAAAPVTALIPAARLYPHAAPANPTWPFGKYGAPTGLPRRATCLDGQEIFVAFHGFSNGRRTNNRLVESAEDHAARIGAAMAAALDGQRFTIPGGFAAVRWTGNSLMMDGDEADAFHVVVNLRIRCSTG